MHFRLTKTKQKTISDFQNKVELDMVVYGSVAVSKLGERIGRGNGYVDLDFATLKHCGSITDKTLIVTVVHDEQVMINVYLNVHCH